MAAEDHPASKAWPGWCAIPSSPTVAGAWPKVSTAGDGGGDPQRLVIDTKFTGVFARGWYRHQTLRAGCVYQLYAYLRSQEGQHNPAAWAESGDGLLLHPAIDTEVDESVQIQGHRLRFATVDLTASHADLRARLLQIPSQE